MPARHLKVRAELIRGNTAACITILEQTHYEKAFWKGGYRFYPTNSTIYLAGTGVNSRYEDFGHRTAVLFNMEESPDFECPAYMWPDIKAAIEEYNRRGRDESI